MKNWKLAAELFRLAINAPEMSDTDPAEYDDLQFDDWYAAASDFLESRSAEPVELPARTNYEKCDTLRKEAIASILDQFKQGKTLVHSEQAYIQNGDSGWDWVGKISADGNDITEQNLSFHTYDTIGDDPDEEYAGKDIWSHIDDISTDCLCAVADNLYA